MKKQYAVLFGFLVIAILLFFNNNFPPVKFITGSIQNIFSSPKSTLYGFKTNISTDESTEIKNLKKENARLVAKMIEYQKLKEDNSALKSQFENGSTLKYEMISARVIGFTGLFSNPTELIIDKGFNDGVKQNAAVIVDNNLVGKINFVSLNSSKILLVQSSAFTTLGKTSENGALGVATGKDDFILFDRVSINDTMTNGETIMTKGEINGEGLGIPPDLVIGKIKAISKNESLPNQSAQVESAIIFSKLKNVFIVLANK